MLSFSVTSSIVFAKQRDAASRKLTEQLRMLKPSDIAISPGLTLLPSNHHNLESFLVMKWKSAFCTLAAITLLAAAGFGQDFKSEVNVEGIAGITQSTNNFVLPYSATVGGGFLAGYRYHFSP